MADTGTVLTVVLGSGTVVGGVALHFLGKGAAERKALEEQTEARVREAYDAREADRQSFVSILAGFQQLTGRVELLEGEVSKLNAEVGSLRSIKQALETQVEALRSKIAQDALTLKTFEQNEVLFHAEIAELRQSLDRSNALISEYRERLAKIDADIKAGKFNPNTLYQIEHVEIRTEAK